MIKRIVSIILLCCMLCLSIFTLSSCLNYNIGPGSYSFKYVHIQMPGMTKPVHLEITSWKDDEGGIELKIKDYGTIILGDGTYMLYTSDTCPICEQLGN